MSHMSKYLLLLVLLIGVLGAKAQQHTITAFSPSCSYTNETVTINGTNFSNITDVRFGGTSAQSFVVVDSTTIRAVVAAGSSQATASGSFVGGGSALVTLSADVARAINQNAHSQKQAEVLMSLIRGGRTVVQKDAQFYTSNTQGQTFIVTASGTLFPVSGMATDLYATLGSPAANSSNQLAIQGTATAQPIPN
ncbi:MAG: hypothetical protein FGM54_11385, partial [Chitinophagaceae bacterium]|nr:hypothetical protein [Chitinophagaceae bacterium]